MAVNQPVSSLDYRAPIVNPTTGTPTLQFIQLFQRLYQNGAFTAEEIAALGAAIAALEVAKVPAGGADGEVLTKLSGSAYDMGWELPPEGAIYAPLVTGALPGPELMATGDGQCIMVEIG